MTEKEIFIYFIKNGLTIAGACGLLGNLYAESHLEFNNLQNSFNKKYNISDEEYTKAVDLDLYKNFINGPEGFGIAQWTYWTRKQKYYNFVKKRGVSIADPLAQLDFLMMELKNSYKSVYNTLITTDNIKIASDVVLTQFEKPADQSQKVKDLRYSYSKSFYNKYASEKSSEVKTDTLRINSTYPCHKSNYGGKRASIEWIVIHYTGNKTDKAVSNAKYFMSANRGASAHYFVDDSEICLSVQENYTAWAVGKKYGNAKYWGIVTNSNSISIELCSTYSQISETTQNNAVKLIKSLMQKYNIPINHIVRHYDVCSKNCPGWTLNTDSGWNNFLKKIDNSYSPKTSAILPYKVKVIATSLNIRSGPGVAYIPIGSLKNGNIVEICEEKNEFLRINGTDNWISKKYVKEVN